MIRESTYFGVEKVPNDDNTRVYHSRLRLLDERWQYQGGFKGIRLAGMSDDQEVPLASVLAFVLDLDGVTFAEVKAYQLTVKKSPLFSWDEIEVNLLPLWLGIKPALEATEVFEIEAQREMICTRYRKILDLDYEAKNADEQKWLDATRAFMPEADKQWLKDMLAARANSWERAEKER